MGNLIVGFFSKFVGTNQPIHKWKVRPVSQISRITLDEVRGQILVNYRHFPLGNEIQFMDRCYAPTEEFEPSDWCTFDPDSKYYSIDNIKVRDGYDQLKAQGISEFVLKLGALSSFLFECEQGNARTTSDCMNVVNLHGHSYMLNSKIFKKFIRQYGLDDFI